MPAHALAQRLSRLDGLSERLSDGAMHTVAELSAELGVSARTLARDLALLRERGWDLESTSGPGGGVRVHHRWAASPLTLRSNDALNLLLALSLAEALGLSIGGQPAALRRQLARGFAPADRTDIAQLRSRLRVAAPLSPDATLRLTAKDPGAALRGQVVQAFATQRVLGLRYRDGQARISERNVEPQYLLLAWPAWYLLAWDRSREAIRTLRLDRIQQVQVQPERFQLRPAAPFWSACEDVGVAL